MSFAEKMAAFLTLMRDMDVWYKANRDVAAPALASFRDLLGSMFSAVPIEKRLLKYKAWEKIAAGDAGNAGEDPAMTEFQALMSRAADALPPLLSRIYFERRKGNGVGTIGADHVSGDPGSDRD